MFEERRKRTHLILKFLSGNRNILLLLIEGNCYCICLHKIRENKQIFEREKTKNQIVGQTSVYQKERKATSVTKREGESDKTTALP